MAGVAAVIMMRQDTVVNRAIKGQIAQKAEEAEREERKGEQMLARQKKASGSVENSGMNNMIASWRGMQGSVRGGQVASLKTPSMKHSDTMDQRRVKAALRIQTAARLKILYPHRLHHANLWQRLLFEHQLIEGFWRLFSQVMVFAFLLIALGRSDFPEVKRGIYDNFAGSFAFSEITRLTDARDFVTSVMPMISRTSKRFFPLSSQYFTPDGGAVELIATEMAFSTPKLVGGVELSVYLPVFSFSGWVKTTAQYRFGYILRKRMVPAGSGSELACWGWYLDSTTGPELHYGSHDYYPTSAADSSSVEQERVRLSHGKTSPAEKYSMLTVVVSQTTVTFYENLEIIGVSDMPRPLTDCFNNYEGLLLGDTGMTIAQLRFYPYALGNSSVEELYRGGATLEDISTGSEPVKASESNFDVLGRTLTSTVQKVGSAVDDQVPRKEVDFILGSIDARGITGAKVLADPAPHGLISVNQTVFNDSLTNRQYYSLFAQDKPYTLVKPPELPPEEPRYFDTSFPSFVGTGVTFSLWWKNIPCESSCGTFALIAMPDKNSPEGRCWSFFPESDGIYWDTPDPDPGYDDYGEVFFLPSKFFLRDNAWRHITWVINQEDDHVYYYLDGVLGVKRPLGKRAGNLDCYPNRYVAFGYRYPGWTYGIPIQVFDFRMYLGAPLTADQVRAIAFPPSNPLGTDICFPLESEAMVDTSWSDLLGHGCEWYFNKRKEFPNLCLFPGVAENCPIACVSKQECYSTEEPPPVFFAYKSIRRIEMVSERGTLCLSKELNKAEVIAQCRKWTSGDYQNDPKAHSWFQEMSLAIGRRVNLTNCEALAQSIDPFCSFDPQPVKDFTKELLARGGDYTIAFFVKPVNEFSLIQESDSTDFAGRFIPHMNFLSTISPPAINVGFGLSLGGQFGTGNLVSHCDGEGTSRFEDVEMYPTATSGWTFFALSRHNSTMPTKASMYTNLNRKQETQGDWRTCLVKDDSFFDAIEFNYEMLVSPIMMIPKDIPYASVQNIYYEQINSMGLREGPLVPRVNKVAKDNVEVTKHDFDSKSVLMASPIIFQQRVLARPEALVACAGRVPNSTETFFGLQPISFNGVGYADFLYSVTDFDMIFREGELRPTADFIDSMTRKVEIVLVFFSPEYGVTSALTFTADFEESRSIDVSVTVDHYAILEADALQVYITAQSLVLLFISFMVIDMARTLGKHIYHYRQDRTILSFSEFFSLLTDIVTVTTVVVFVALRIPAKIGTATNTQSILDGLATIPWASDHVGIQEKKTTFFSVVQRLNDLMSQESEVDTFLNIILLIILARLVQCTSLHPRLALLTGTIRNALDDFWHAAILILLLMGSFAGIGTWRFGNQRADFATFETTMQTEFMLLLGQFPASLESWQDNKDLVAWIVIYLIVMYLLVLNFILAIIVEAYMGVRQLNEDLEIEQEFTRDCFDCFSALTLKWRHGWPDFYTLGTMQRMQKAKLTTGLRELVRSGLFPTVQSAVEFVKFYKGFSFLEPPRISSSGVVKKGDNVADQIEMRMAKLLNLQRPKLKDHVEEAVNRHPDLVQNFKSFAPGGSPSKVGGGGRTMGFASMAMHNMKRQGSILKWAGQSPVGENGVEVLDDKSSDPDVAELMAAVEKYVAKKKAEQPSPGQKVSDSDSPAPQRPGHAHFRSPPLIHFRGSGSSDPVPAWDLGNGSADVANSVVRPWLNLPGSPETPSGGFSESGIPLIPLEASFRGSASPRATPAQLHI